jgi:hypothetical protein
VSVRREIITIIIIIPSIIRINKSRRITWAGHVARMGREECI